MDKPAFTIAGETIEAVPLDDYSLDEAAVLYKCSDGLTLDQVEEVEGFHPGLVKGLIAVSYARAHPEATEKQVFKVIGGLKIRDLQEVFESISVEVEDAVPPPQALEESAVDIGPTSNDGGELSPENTQEPGSGPPGSLTSLEDFAQVIWENSRRGNLTASGT